MSFSELLLAVPVWWINGILAVLYALASHLEEFAVLLAGMIILLSYDPQVQRRASSRPRRYGRGELQTSPPVAQYFTLGTLLAWIPVSLTSRFPVPLLGVLLWWVGLAGILVLPEERYNQLWWAKTGILVYAGIVLALRFSLEMLAQASPADWAGVVGDRLGAEMALVSTRSSLATVGMLFVFVLYPVGYCGLLLNRFLRNPKSVFTIGREAGDVIRRLRTRQ